MPPEVKVGNWQRIYVLLVSFVGVTWLMCAILPSTVWLSLSLLTRAWSAFVAAHVHRMARHFSGVILGGHLESQVCVRRAKTEERCAHM